MRGKPKCFLIAAFMPRNIPAYAGKTASIACETSMPPGTSPRMRGKLNYAILTSFSDRNIPAYAGKTARAVTGNSGSEEHPRVCGENL